MTMNRDIALHIKHNILFEIKSSITYDSMEK